MRILLVALLLMASLTAGCFGGDDDEPPVDPEVETPPVDPGTGGGGQDDPPPEPVTEIRLLSNFIFDSCTGVRLSLPVAADAAQALLPEGYTAVVDASSPLPDSEQVHVGIQLYNCTSFTAGPYAYEDVYFGMASIPVDAPADAVEADVHAYIIEMIAGEDVLAAIWPAAGYASYNGTMRVTQNEAVRSYGPAPYTLEVYGGTAPVELGSDQSFAWYHELENGDRLTWTGQESIDGDSGGAANAAIPSESKLAPLLTPPLQNLNGEGAFVDGASFTEMYLVQELAAGRE